MQEIKNKLFFINLYSLNELPISQSQLTNTLFIKSSNLPINMSLKVSYGSVSEPLSDDNTSISQK
jgi:hypothetical protein